MKPKADLATASTDPVVCALTIGIGLCHQSNAANLLLSPSDNQQSILMEQVKFNFTIPMNIDTTTPPTPSSPEIKYKEHRIEFTFKAYRPALFSSLRQSCCELDEGEFSRSLSSITQMIRYGKLANSGSQFYYSPCNRWIVKTIPAGQVKFFLSIVDQYSNYLHSHPMSLLLRILGVYRVQWKPVGGIKLSRPRKTVYLMVTMNTLFNPQFPLAIQPSPTGLDDNNTSTGNSNTDAEQSVRRSSGLKANVKALLKSRNGGIIVYDLKASGLRHPQDTRDMKRIQQDAVQLLVEQEQKQRLCKVAEMDVQFLITIGVNDYSLLLGIHHLNDNSITDTNSSHSTGSHWHSQLSLGKNEVYYLGLIDILSQWNLPRRVGYWLMPWVYLWYPRYTPPHSYGQRALQSIEELFQKRN